VVLVSPSPTTDPTFRPLSAFRSPEETTAGRREGRLGSGARSVLGGADAPRREGTAARAALPTSERCAIGCGRRASTLFLATDERLCSDCWWRSFEALIRFRRCA